MRTEMSVMTRPEACSAPRYRVAGPVLRAGSRDLDHRIHFHGRVQRQNRYSDGGPGVATGVAEHLDHEVGCAVDHLGYVMKVRMGVDESAQLHDTQHAGEIAVT